MHERAAALRDAPARFQPNPRLYVPSCLDHVRSTHQHSCDYRVSGRSPSRRSGRHARLGFRRDDEKTTKIFKETDVADVLDDYAFTDDVGIDGMLCRTVTSTRTPRDPASTMTRAEHEEVPHASATACARTATVVLASWFYQDSYGDCKPPVRPVGIGGTRNPDGWKGPCYLLTDGIFPTDQGVLDGIEWERYGPGTTRPLRALRHHFLASSSSW